MILLVEDEKVTLVKLIYLLTLLHNLNTEAVQLNSQLYWTLQQKREIGKAVQLARGSHKYKKHQFPVKLYTISCGGTGQTESKISTSTYRNLNPYDKMVRCKVC